MSFRSLGGKILNNAKIFAQSTVSPPQILNSDHKNEENNEYKQKTEKNSTPPIQRSARPRNSGRRKKRQRMHFRPIIPDHYICPITQELMTDPVIISSGHTFERTAIVEWFEDGNTINPLTGQSLQNIDIKPNYALKDAIKEYRRKLADELFRISFDETTNEEVLHYRNNILFSTESDTINDCDDEKIVFDNYKNENENDNFDGYLSDDEQEYNANNNLHNLKKKKVKIKKKYKRESTKNIPIIAFLGPNNTGKSTLLNLIVGETVFVTIDELSDYDTLSKIVRFKIVTRADRQFILLDVEGLFPHKCDSKNVKINDSVLKVFFAVYSIASVIVWNDTNENNPYLKNLLHTADEMMKDLNSDGNYYFRPCDIKDMKDYGNTPNGGLLPEELRQFLLKKYKKLTKAETKRGINIGKTYTHKPAFIILRRDFKQTVTADNDIIINRTNMHTDSDKPHCISPWLSSENKQHSSPSLFSLSSPHSLPPFITESHTDSPSESQSNVPPKYSKNNYQILSKNNPSSASYGDSGNDSAVSVSISNNTANNNNQSLSIVDELKEESKEQKHDMSDSSALMDNVLNHNIIYGDNTAENINIQLQKKCSLNTILFSDYVQKHDDFQWLRQLNLFSFVDGCILHKLDGYESINDDWCQDDSLLSVLPKLDYWINEWCHYSKNIIPMVRNNRDMLVIIEIINKHNMISSTKYVEQCMQCKESRLQRYFYYDSNERTVNELKLIAERFKWDNQNLIRWFIKHFERLWYYIKDFPNAQYALLYQSLFFQYYLSESCGGKNENVIPKIVLNLSHFYYQISNKVDLYRNIVDRSSKWGEFAGAVGGLGSLGLMSVIHPLVGIAAVPFSIHFASSLGNKSGAKVGDAIAYSKAHFVDRTERYDLGKIEPDKPENMDKIADFPCCDSGDNDKERN